MENQIVSMVTQDIPALVVEALFFLMNMPESLGIRNALTKARISNKTMDRLPVVSNISILLYNVHFFSHPMGIGKNSSKFVKVISNWIIVDNCYLYKFNMYKVGLNQR